jgi:hypothetical protein
MVPGPLWNFFYPNLLIRTNSQPIKPFSPQNRIFNLLSIYINGKIKQKMSSEEIFFAFEKKNLKLKETHTKMMANLYLHKKASVVKSIEAFCF